MSITAFYRRQQLHIYAPERGTVELRRLVVCTFRLTTEALVRDSNLKVHVLFDRSLFLSMSLASANARSRDLIRDPFDLVTTPIIITVASRKDQAIATLRNLLPICISFPNLGIITGANQVYRVDRAHGYIGERALVFQPRDESPTSSAEPARGPRAGRECPKRRGRALKGRPLCVLAGSCGLLAPRETDFRSLDPRPQD